MVLIANELVDEKWRLGEEGWYSKLTLERPATMWIDIFWDHVFARKCFEHKMEILDEEMLVFVFNE